MFFIEVMTSDCIGYLSRFLLFVLDRRIVTKLLSVAVGFGRIPFSYRISVNKRNKHSMSVVNR